MNDLMNPKVFSINGIGHNSHRQWTFHYSSCYRSTCRCIPVCTQVHDQCHVRRLVVIIVLSWCFQCVQKYRKIASNLFTYMGTHIPCTVHVHTSFFTYLFLFLQVTRYKAATIQVATIPTPTWCFCTILSHLLFFCFHQNA